MGEQLKALLEGINVLKSGQEDMQKSQGENGEYAEREESRGRNREQVEEIGRIKEQFEEIGRIKEQIEERIGEVAGNFTHRFKDLEKSF
ncbi:hypothetical protein TNCV_3540001 [Trichonephila clavipes]|nr:hypothetical protein TNCV_3540001 [Trichonephila clavipes]